ncbi:MAG: hypothetical protein C0594_14395 [Marinilabiliales bacterium]|nr:MAG: hypothetical protein C0594_14395 [Marinilabiliales bacterium]
MTLIDFSREDIIRAEKEGNHEVYTFIIFLKELVDHGYLDHPTEIGVAKYIISNGTESLTRSQRKVLKEQIMKKFPQNDCELCGEPIPYDELLESYDNGGYCSRCKHNLDKED